MQQEAITSGSFVSALAADPISIEIIKGGLTATVREMEVLIERTSMSAFVREKKDFHTGIYSGRGKCIASSGVGSFGDLVGTVWRFYPPETMRDGDIYWYNDCYESDGVVTHTPDQVFITPVFDGRDIVAYVESWAHFNDVGGMRPGSLSSDCTEIFQEGVIVPPVRVARDGQISDELLRVFCRNSRFPDMVRGDMRALMAAIRFGKKRVEEIVGRFGRPVVEDAFDRLIDAVAEASRAKAREVFADGVYRTSETLDNDGLGNGPFRIRYTLEVSDGEFSLDATGTDDQAPGSINLLMNPKMPGVMLSSYLLGDTLGFMNNDGLGAMLPKAKLREGSLLRPKFPAALGSRGVTLMRQMVACMGLVAVATRGNANASHSAYVIYYLRGKTGSGEYFLLSDGVGVGYGGRPTGDGNDAIYLVANENYPCEFVELNYPMRIREYAINRDTAGPGRWRGGCGVVREIEVLADEAMLSVRIDSVDTPPWGVNGGQAGRPGSCIINPGRPDERKISAFSDGTIVRRGDVVRVMTGGGGGWGHPYDREPERVLQDVLNGFVSSERAREDYGVVLNDSGVAVDAPATRRRRADRPATKLFHQNGYKDEIA